MNLQERIDTLKANMAKEDITPWESQQNEALFLQIEMSHAELQAFQSIAQTLKSIGQDGLLQLIRMIVDCNHQLEALTVKVSALEVLIDDSLVQPLQAIKRDIASIPDYDTQEPAKQMFT